MSEVTDIRSRLAQLAVPAFQKSVLERGSVELDFVVEDPILHVAQGIANNVPRDAEWEKQVVNLVSADPDFALLAPKAGEHNPILLHPHGASRTSLDRLVLSLFSTAYLRMFFLRLPNEEDTFVSQVLEGLDNLRLAIAGEEITAYRITGYAHISLPEGESIETPWGVVRPTPPSKLETSDGPGSPPSARCLLVEKLRLPIKFDRAPNPKNPFSPSDRSPAQSTILFPLSCALASQDTTKPVVPIVTWSTILLPFQYGFGYSRPFPTSWLGAHTDVVGIRHEIQGWSMMIAQSHTSKIEIAARRLISAAAHRMDRSDALIDAVMVWENLLGNSFEVSFRVSASLAKLIEHDPAKRQDLYKRMLKIYGVRSKVVHGANIDGKKVEQAHADAISYALRGMRESYKRGAEWLGRDSGERADEILLQ